MLTGTLETDRHLTERKGEISRVCKAERKKVKSSLTGEGGERTNTKTARKCRREETGEGEKKGKHTEVKEGKPWLSRTGRTLSVGSPQKEIPLIRKEIPSV